MDKNSNEDIKAKMQAALSRKIGINGVPNAEVDGKNKKIEAFLKEQTFIKMNIGNKLMINKLKQSAKEKQEFEYVAEFIKDRLKEICQEITTKKSNSTTKTSDCSWCHFQ